MTSRVRRTMHYAWERSELNKNPCRKTWRNERPESTEDNVKMDLKVGWKCVGWIYLTQVWDQWRAVLIVS
jgi:hypothetical protein